MGVWRGDREYLLWLGGRHPRSEKPAKRRANRRYYQRQDVLIIRQIRSLLYEQGFTIGGARNRLTGDDAQVDLNQSQQLIHQMRLELEELIKILRPSFPRGSNPHPPIALSFP